MKAVMCPKYGPAEVLKVVDVPIPKPTKDQILIKVFATSVNSADVRIRGLDVGDMRGAPIVKFIIRCVFGFTGPRKKIVGMVLAGEVVEVGSAVTKFKIGDKVFGMTGLAMGAFAEYAVVTERQTIARMPQNASFEEAAAIPFGGTTALYFLQKAEIEKARRVLIYGATGAVGTAAVQIASSYGVEVTAVCGEDGIAMTRELGATTVYDYKKQPLRDIIGQFDIIFDAVGKTKNADVAHLLAPQSTYVTVGGFDTAKDSSAQLEKLAKLYDEGKYRAVIDRVYNLDQIVEAEIYVESRRKKGNVIVTLL